MSELTPRDRNALNAYEQTEEGQQRLRRRVLETSQAPDPDPLFPSDVDLAYAEGWTDGQDVRLDEWERAQRHRERRLLGAIGALTAIAVITLFLLGFATGRVTAAPRPAAQGAPSTLDAAATIAPWGGAGAARRAHNPEVAGASPAPATTLPPPSAGTVAVDCAPANSAACQELRATPTPRPTPVRAGNAGTASWYDDGPGLYAAVHSFRFGDTPYPIVVCRFDDGRSICITVIVRDYCQCYVGTAREVLVDLSPDAFSRSLYGLGVPLTAGHVHVSVTGMRR